MTDALRQDPSSTTTGSSRPRLIASSSRLALVMMVLIGCSRSPGAPVDTSSVETGLPIASASLGYTYVLVACTWVGLPTYPPPCVTANTPSFYQLVDSGKLTFAADRSFNWSTWRRDYFNLCYLSGKTCADSAAGFSSEAGTYVLGDSIVALTVPYLNGFYEMTLAMPRTPRVPPSWAGPDSLVFKDNSDQGMYTVYKRR